MAAAGPDSAGGRAPADGAGAAGRARAGRGADGAASASARASGDGAASGTDGTAAGTARSSAGASAARRDPSLRAARYRVDRDAAEDASATGSRATDRAGAAGAPAGEAARSEPERLPTVDELRTIARVRLDQAIARGEFDDLPGAGKPLPGLTGTHDPDWWIKGLIERENLSGLAPPALSLRTEHERFDAALDALTTERAVREAVADFNARVVEARRQLTGGPPVITPTRDLDDDLRRWRERREERRRAAAAAVPPPPPTWWERRRAAREERARRRAR